MLAALAEMPDAIAVDLILLAADIDPAIITKRNSISILSHERQNHAQ